MSDSLTGCWRGWWRAPGGIWSQLASGNSFEDCRAALLDALGHLRGRRGQTAVLPAGAHPDSRPATFGRRRF
jgi:hypothetical protein